MPWDLGSGEASSFRHGGSQAPGNGGLPRVRAMTTEDGLPACAEADDAFEAALADDHFASFFNAFCALPAFA